MNSQWIPVVYPQYVAGAPFAGYPYSPYVAPPDHTGAKFRNYPLPTYSNVITNVPLPDSTPPVINPVGIPQMPRARPFGNHNQQRPYDLDHPLHHSPLPHRWGEPVEAGYIPDQPATMPQPAIDHDPPGWGQMTERARDTQSIGRQESENYNGAFPGAVPYNDDKWPWNLDNSRLPVAADVARRQFSMRRPAKAKLRRRHSGFSRIPVLNEFTLALRPSDWRPDYPARSSGLLRRLSRIGEPKPSCLAGRKNYTINALLLYNDPRDYPVTFDLRQEPEVGEITFMNLDRPSNSLDFCQLATTPPIDELCLWHPRLPWYIQIRASQSNGITIQDVFCQMQDHLAEPIWANHYWNVELSSKDREEMRGAFQYRCDGNQKLWRKGIARIDFLRFDCVFVGLAKSKDGMWEIKTKEATG